MSSQDIRTAVHAARRLHQSGAGTVLDVLLRDSTLKAEQLAADLRQHAGVMMLQSAADATPDYSVMDLAVAQRLLCVPVRCEGEHKVCLAMPDPWDEAALQQAAAVLGQVPAVAAVTSALMKTWLETEAGPVVPAGFSKGPAFGAAVAGAKGPVVDFVDSALREAYARGASDVHFECGRSGVLVRFRLDGVMSPFATMADPARAEEVISRIKVLAQLDITERRIPQDGRFRFDVAGGSVDLRVSIMPSVAAEDAVLRILDKAQLRARDATTTLDRLGFDVKGEEAIRALAELPHGMLLVTGPTGSGKTTTVYAILSDIHTGVEKVITIEDPVEYELPGVLQIPVNEKKGLTFAKGLRSILRHDPDRILVGEIRDAETAEIAVQSALTGHQVFTTVHANNLFDVIGRFRHFGIDMFGLVSSLNGVLVQRLVRRLCSCAAQRPATERELRWIESHAIQVSTVPQAVGCPLCQSSGYRGRSVIAEVHAIDDVVRDLVIQIAPVSVLRDRIAQSGVHLLGWQAARLVADGVTTTEEVKRVVGWL